MVKIASIMSKHEEILKGKIENYKVDSSGKTHLSLVKMVNCLQKKKKVAFLKLKFNKMKFERKESMNMISKCNSELCFGKNSEGIFSKKNSVYSLRDQSTLLIKFPFQRSKSSNPVLLNKKSKIVKFVIRRTLKKLRFSFIKLKSLLDITRENKFIINLNDKKIVKRFGRGSIILEPPNQKLEDSSSFSAIPKKNQFSGYLSLGSLNNSIIDNSKDSKKSYTNPQILSKKAVSFLNGLNSLKKIFFKKKKSMLE